MGAGETIAVAVSSTATIRGALLIVREWLKANRKRVVVEIDGVGRIEAEGPVDIDALVERLDSASGE
jgi:hypothetical protein